ncbi:universal stress protein [uncultured Algibacter sp.]|uniref:universal stress protein n=1 Tax=uncultured Algibacter sp. TaxID=298659 RepID=UPI0032176807
MRNILLPTDFSKNSVNAINYALQLFENWECTFYVLNVQKQSDFILDDFMTVPANSSVNRTIAQDNKKELKQFITKVKQTYSDKNFMFIPLFDFDSLTHSIKETVIKKNIDLIVMGTNGATGAKEVVFGSNTLNVIRKVNCPILAIPENYTFKGFKSVLFSIENCIDSNNNNNNNSLIPLKDILSHFNASLSVLDIDFSNEKKNRDSFLKNLFEKQNYNYYRVTDVPAPMAISTITQLLDYDMHALFIESKSFINRFLFGSDTHEISYRTRIPLLVLRN